MLLVFTIVFCTLVALGFGGAAAWSDYNKFIIPGVYVHAIAIAFIPAFAVMSFYSPETAFFSSWKSHLAAAAITFGITLLMFKFKVFGGGDAKLLTAYALWMGVGNLLILIYYVALVGGIVALTTLALKKWQPVAKPAEGSWIHKAQNGQKEVPYGIAIFIGALAAFWQAGYLKPAELLELATAGGGL